MISIKRFLASDNREAAEAFERMAYLLLQAIGLHAVIGNRADLDSFQATLAGVQNSLEHDSTPQNILTAAGLAAEAVQDYNRRTSVFVQAKAGELQDMVAMLTHAMSQISDASQNSVSRLQELQKQIEHAAMLDDMRALKSRLADCLESIRGEMARQRNETRQLLSDLGRGLRNVEEEKPDGAAPSEPGDSSDPLTGLPQKPEAKEAIIAAAYGAGSHVYAGLFVVDRIQSIHSRFGSTLADQALIFFLQYLTQALSPADRLFRWDEASFLALIERDETPEQVRRALAKAFARRSEQTFDINGRSVVLPLSSTWTVLPLHDHTRPEILQKLETFRTTLRRK